MWTLDSRQSAAILVVAREFAESFSKWITQETRLCLARETWMEASRSGGLRTAVRRCRRDAVLHFFQALSAVCHWRHCAVRGPQMTIQGLPYHTSPNGSREFFGRRRITCRCTRLCSPW